MKKRRNLLGLAVAAALSLSPLAALAQTVTSAAGPTPPAGAAPPYAPLGGCVYMPNGVALTGYVGPMGLTCGANGALNVNVLTGGSGGGSSGGGGAVYGPTAPGAAPAAGTAQQPVLNGFLDAGGLARTVAPSTPLPVIANPPAITTAANFSVNQISIAAATTAPATNVLLITVPTNPSRVGGFFIQSQSKDRLFVYFDDGTSTATDNSDPSRTMYILDPAAQTSQQGASMGSADIGNHTGRIRVYGGNATDQVALRVY